MKPAQISIGLALLVFLQNFGTAIAIVISNTIFAQTLSSSVARYAPSVSSKAALEAGSGASAVRALVAEGREEELQGLLKAYSESLRNVFYFLIAVSSLAAIVSLGMGWKNVRKEKQDKKTQA